MTENVADSPKPRTTQLLGEITRCPEVLRVWAGAGASPCQRIVESQASPRARFQVPEPWSGRIESAPVLLISSNPSISDAEPYPRWDEDQATRLRFFNDRFGEGRDQIRKGSTCP